MRKRACVLGIGAIGSAVATAIHAQRAGPVDLAGIADRPAVEAELNGLAGRLRVPYTTNPPELIAFKPHLVIEAASQDAVRDHGVAFLDAGCDLLVLSVGALTDAALLGSLKEAAARSGARVVVPSGAIGGLDALAAAAVGDLRSLELVTSKPPQALADAPVVRASGIDVSTLTRPHTFFDGSARDAAAALPANLNVAAAIMLASGSEEVRVRVIADPGLSLNTHEIHARGDFGEMLLRFANTPSANPRTSQLAAYAAIAAIRAMSGSLLVL